MKLRNHDMNQVLKKPVTVSGKATLLDARSVLLRYKISRIIVTDNEKPIGILTEKDLVKSIYGLGDRSIQKVPVAEVMTRRLVTVKEGSTLYDCARAMTDNRISSVLVLKKGGLLDGIITKTDLTSVFLTQSTAPVQVYKIMTKNVVTAKPADSLLFVENLLVKHRLSRVVIERNRKPVGMITHRDFIPAKVPLWIRQSANSREIENFRMADKPAEFLMNQLSYLSTFIAADIMSPNPITVLVSDDVSEAALLMIRNGISGLPVVKNSVLVGIMTKTDIVRYITRAD